MDSDHDEPKHPQIDLWRILQLVALVITIASSVFGSYLFINGRISDQATVIATLQLQVVEISKRQQQADDDRRQIIKEMSSTLALLQTQLVDVRILIASIRDGVPHK